VFISQAGFEAALEAGSKASRIGYSMMQAPRQAWLRGRSLEDVLLSMKQASKQALKQAMRQVSRQVSRVSKIYLA